MRKRELLSHPSLGTLPARKVLECIFALSPTGNILHHHPATKETFPNNSFLLVLGDLYARDTPLIVGCDTGERASQAALQLLEVGYTDVAVMQEGFAGWRKLRLPATGDNRAGISYVSLLTKVKRKGKKKTVHAAG